MRLLEVEDLQTQFFGRDSAMRAVDGVTFYVDAGETLGLVGESGCGKSVTALSIMQLIPDPPGRIVGGSIKFGGRNLVGINEKEMRELRGSSIAMIFQDPMTSLNPVLTIGRQIAEVLVRHLRLSKREARERTIELLAMVGIPSPETRFNAYPHEFSGGMRQRAITAMALACRPKLLLADEITTALDVTVQAQILDLVRGLARELGTAVVLITHDLGIIAGMTQRVHVMYAGQIVEKATTAELFRQPMMPYTWGLLRSIPRVDQPATERLVPIEGLPPSLSDPPSGCRFEPRCPYRRAICAREVPLLAAVSVTEASHEARCWGTQDVPDGGWLRGVDWRNDLGDQRVMADIRRTARSAYEPASEVPPAAMPKTEVV